MCGDDTTLSTSLKYPSKTTLNNKTTQTVTNEEHFEINERLRINTLVLKKGKTNYMFFICIINVCKLTIKLDFVYIEKID